MFDAICNTQYYFQMMRGRKKNWKGKRVNKNSTKKVQLFKNKTTKRRTDTQFKIDIDR